MTIKLDKMITIIDYNAGNIRSVLRACAEVGAEAVTTSDPAIVAKAEKIIFPGVGAAPSAMEYLSKMGLDAALKNAFKAGIPILGICLGAQIVLDSSEEGNQKCLGLVPGKTVRFRLKDKLLKIPHMGWNEIKVVQPHPCWTASKRETSFTSSTRFTRSPPQRKTSTPSPITAAISARRWESKPVRHPVPPGKKRSAGTGVAGTVCEMGWEWLDCSLTSF